jgi:hypothetical protein
MSFLTERDVFFTEHHDCCDLKAGVSGPSYGSRARAGPVWRADEGDVLAADA